MPRSTEASLPYRIRARRRRSPPLPSNCCAAPACWFAPPIRSVCRTLGVRVLATVRHAMRPTSRRYGDSPRRHFFGVDYAQAEEHCAGRAFVHCRTVAAAPIYVAVDSAAQAALGVIHRVPRRRPRCCARDSVSAVMSIFRWWPGGRGAARIDLATLRNYRRYSASAVDRTCMPDGLLLACQCRRSNRSAQCWRRRHLDPEQAQAMIARDTAAALQIELARPLLVAGGGYDAGTFDPA